MTSHFDVVIVGGGSAGCVLAARLSEDLNCSVGLVEAGFDAQDPEIGDPSRWPFLPGRSYDWAYRTTPQAGTAGRRHDWPRGRLLGGSSALNAMAHVRGHPSDFETWAAAAGPLWGFDSLLPAFRRSECFSGGASSHHGADGPLPVLLPDAETHPLVRAFMAAGLSLGAPHLGDHNAGPLAGVAPNQLTIRDGRRVTAADAYLTPVAGRANLQILRGLAVERLLIASGSVTGLLVADETGTRVVEADQVILSSGALGSPLLLMRSGIGDPESLHAAGVPCLIENRNVGRNLHDHLLAAGLIFAARQPIAPSRLQHSESLMYLHAADPSRSDGAPDSVVACVTLPVVTECVDRPQAGNAFTLMCGFTHPDSRGTITLSGPSSSDAPVIDPAYLSTAHDRAAFRASLRLARSIAEAAPFDPWRGAELVPGSDCRSDDDIDAFLARAAMTHHHPVGTCRMGHDSESVLDAKLGVRGLDNLHVVDASVIPTITTGPVNAAVLAMAEHWVASISPFSDQVIFRH